MKPLSKRETVPPRQAAVHRKQGATAQAHATGDLHLQQTPFGYPLQDVCLSKLIWNTQDALVCLPALQWPFTQVHAAARQ